MSENITHFTGIIQLYIYKVTGLQLYNCINVKEYDYSNHIAEYAYAYSHKKIWENIKGELK